MQQKNFYCPAAEVLLPLTEMTVILMPSLSIMFMTKTLKKFIFMSQLTVQNGYI